MKHERTPERLAAALPWPQSQVLTLYVDVLNTLTAANYRNAASAAYSGVMAAGAVFAAARQDCPTPEQVLTVIGVAEGMKRAEAARNN